MKNAIDPRVRLPPLAARLRTSENGLATPRRRRTTAMRRQDCSLPQQAGSSASHEKQ